MAYDTNMLLCHLCIFFGEISVKIFACFLNCVVFFFTFTDVFLSALGQLLRMAFSGWVELGPLVGCGAQASGRGFSCCGEQAVGARASVVVVPGLGSCGPQALERGLSSCGTRAQLPLGMCPLASSQIRDQTCEPCIDRQTLNHWITRELL